MNAVDPQFVMPIFDGALAANVDYMDMAMSLSQPNAEQPFEKPGIKLGDEQFAKASDWQQAGRLALVGMGMDPGLVGRLRGLGREATCSTPMASTRCTSATAVTSQFPASPSLPCSASGRRSRSASTRRSCGTDGEWQTTEPFSAAEMFPFPEGIGEVECVNVEHEEVLLVPRPGWTAASESRSSTRWARTSSRSSSTIHALGMDRTDKVQVKGVEVSPRDVLAAITPDPAKLGDRMIGRAIVGTWVIGRKDGSTPRGLPVPDDGCAEVCGAFIGLGAVAWQTGFNPVIAMELLASGHVVAEPGFSGQRRSTPSPTSPCSTSTASTTRWSRWNPGGTDPHDAPTDHHARSIAHASPRSWRAKRPSTARRTPDVRAVPRARQEVAAARRRQLVPVVRARTPCS